MSSVTPPVGLGGDGNTYSDDGTGARDMLNGGHRDWFIPLVGQVIVLAQSASNSAVAAAAGAAALTATSSTSVTVGSGSKSFTASTGKSLVAGQVVAAVRTSAPSSYQMFGTVTSYNSGTGALVLNITDTVGSGTYSDWTIVPAGIRGATGASGASAVLLSVTGAATLGVSDKGKYVEITGASTFTLGFSAAATLASGWYAFVVHNGTGIVTLDPNSTEQIDGLTSYPMHPGEARLIQCTGTELKSVVLRPFYRSFTSGGTFIDPPGYSRIGYRGWGGGGDGGRSNSATVAGGGGGGACLEGSYTPSAGTSRTITVAAAGTGQTSAAAGANGNNSSLGSVATFYGGGGGGTSAFGGGGGGASSAGGQGGASNGTPGLPSGSGYGGGNEQSNISTAWGGGSGGRNGTPSTGGPRDSVWGGAGGGAGSGTAGERTAGASLFGGAGGAGGDTTNGTAGTAPGGGGGGTRTGTSSGGGARGQVDIWGIV